MKFVACCLFLLACGTTPTAGVGDDAGSVVTRDGGVDAGTSPEDGGTSDAGMLDAGMLDAGMLDAGMLDAGMLDAGPSSFADAGHGPVDLILKPGSFQLVNPPADYRYRVGSEIRFRFEVANTLSGRAPPTTARVSFRKAFELGATFAVDLAVSVVGGSSERVVNGSTLAAADLGAYDIIVSVDALNQIEEDSESNNVFRVFSAFAIVE